MILVIDPGPSRSRVLGGGPTKTLNHLALVRDWTATSVGSPDAWPESLRTIVGLILANSLPITVFWGPDAVLIYNDAYASVLGARHPEALGRSASEVFKFHPVRPDTSGNHALELEQLHRSADAAAMGDSRWQSCLSPIRDEAGQLAGGVAILKESSASDRFLLELSDALFPPAADPALVQATAARMIGVHLRADRVFFATIAGQSFTIDAEFAEGEESIAGRRYPLDVLGADAIARMRRGETLLMTDDPLTYAARHGSPSPGAAASICIANDGRWEAMLHVSSATRRVWTRSEVVLAQQAARRAWAASDQVRTEQAIRTSLNEKESVLRHLHHRVKNNLQLIASLINLQANEVEDPRILAMFEAIRGRVHSIATIYDLKLDSQAASELDIGAYARTVAPELVRLHGGEESIQLYVEGCDATLPTDRAVTFGLLLNELISNACRHAFPANRRGQLRVRIERQDEQNSVVVADNGVGLPEGFDYHHPSSLGLRLIHMLAQQLGGRVHVTSTDGVRVEVRFH